MAINQKFRVLPGVGEQLFVNYLLVIDLSSSQIAKGVVGSGATSCLVASQ